MKKAASRHYDGLSLWTLYKQWATFGSCHTSYLLSVRRSPSTSLIPFQDPFGV